MRRIRFKVLGFASFVMAFFLSLFTPGSWVNRAIATTMCGVIGACSPGAIANLMKGGDRAFAADVPVLVGQRSSEFDDYKSRTGEFDDNSDSSTRTESSDKPIRDNPEPQTNTNHKIQKTINFSTPSFKSISSDSFAMSQSNQNGCQYTSIFKRKDGRFYQASIDFKSSGINSCGTESFVATLGENGDKLEIKQARLNGSLIFELINEKKIRAFYKHDDNLKNLGDFSIVSRQDNDFNSTERGELNKYLEPHLPMKSNSTCSENKTIKLAVNIEKACEFIDKSKKAFDALSTGLLIGSSMIALGNALGLVGFAAATTVAVPILAGVAAATAIVGLGYYVLKGGMPPLPFQNPLTSVVYDVISKQQDVSDYKITRELDNGLQDIRRDLGIDWCDPKEDTEKNDNQKKTTAKSNWRKNKSGPKKQGKSYGDPHIITFDGYSYSFQTIGEFTLVKSNDEDFEIQVRQGGVPGRQVSLNTGAAMKVGNHRVAFYSKDFPDGDTSTPVRIDGKPVQINGDFQLDGGSISGSNGNYTVNWDSGEQVTISSTAMAGMQFMNVAPSVPEEANRYSGILGDLDGNPKNDLRTRSGKVIPTKDGSTYGILKNAISSFVSIPLPISKLETVFFDQLYKDFGDSWRISQPESLFDYAPGQSTETFTKRGYPNTYMTLASFLPPQLKEAEATCQQFNVGADMLDGCIFDVANTGEAGFAKAAANMVVGKVKQRAEQEIRKRIPLPFSLPF
jgi:hypothetical protein